MNIPRSVTDVLSQHVTLEVEAIDRMYLNVYQPKLQYDQGVVSFFRWHRGATFASSVLMEPISRAFVAEMERFAKRNHVPLITFTKQQRKDDVAHEYLAKFTQAEGVLFIGKAQEKTPALFMEMRRTEKRRDPATGQTYPWMVKSTALVNHFYVYFVDEDFGPCFLKFCTKQTALGGFPYNAKLCLNGHEYLQRQLAQEKIPFEPLDNAILSCANPPRMQPIADELSAEKIDALLRKWLDRLPHPFSATDRAAGYVYDVSILQAEFARTQVLDQPLTGRVFFEQVIRENLDLGRPDQVPLIFDRRVTKRTPGRFRTRVLTAGVTPSLHVDYKRSRIQQYHQEGRALRTETTINDTRDFDVGKRLVNLPALRQIGFAANRRLLDVPRLSHDCFLGEAAFRQVNDPIEVSGQRASALRFGDPTVMALFAAWLVFRLLPRGCSNRDLRDHWAPLLGKSSQSITAGQMTYQLRRLRLHGLIRRQRGTHRYELTDTGWKVSLYCTRLYDRALRPGLSQWLPHEALDHSPLRDRFDKLDAAIQQFLQQNSLAA